MNDVAQRAPKTDWEIAQQAKLLPIQEVARKLGIPSGSVEPFGHHKAKIGMDFIERSFADRPDGQPITWEQSCGTLRRCWSLDGR